MSKFDVDEIIQRLKTANKKLQEENQNLTRTMLRLNAETIELRKFSESLREAAYKAVKTEAEKTYTTISKLIGELNSEMRPSLTKDQFDKLCSLSIKYLPPKIEG